MYEFRAGWKTLALSASCVMALAVLLFALGYVSGLSLAQPESGATPPDRLAGVGFVDARILAREEPVELPEAEPPSLVPTRSAGLEKLAERARRGSLPYRDLIYRVSIHERVDPTLVAAVIWVESAFDSRAVSHKGARGLMQVMPATAARFGVEPHRLFEPEPNLRAGTRYLGWLGERYRGDVRLVLSAYNAGEAAVDRFGGIPPYPETRNYVRRVETTLDQARRGRLGGGRERWSIDFY